MRAPLILCVTLALAAAGCGEGGSTAAAPAASTRFFHEGGVALRGQDVVAYFEEGKAVPGSADHSHDWGGVTWRFASEARRAAFAAEPERFAPQFGGYCAWAVAKGYTAETDPAAFDVVNDKLYLNYNLDVQSQWRQGRDERIRAAEANWPKVLGD